MLGNWRKAYDYLSSVTSWSLLPSKTEVLDMLKAKLQECGLRTYLLAYGSFYRSLSQEQLCEMFDLPDKQVRGLPLLEPEQDTPNDLTSSSMLCAEEHIDA